ncbi:MAG TPA: zf-HC2 domain-containing protein [Verrucomicrobiae bacterium]|nr:zf-HC2 domain-containing protein [Verrucomicrobiae bacterium]
MNCVECRDQLVACIEGLLDHDDALQCQAHLESCAACRAERDAIAHLQRRLVTRGQLAADVSLVEPVMRRIRAVDMEPERTTIMSIVRKHRWGFGLGAAAAAAAAAIVIAVVGTTKSQAAAIEVMTKGAEAVSKLSSIHLRGQVRTSPQDNFSYINADSPFYSIELWKQFQPELKWRVEKPMRVVVMDGQSTVMLIKTGDEAVKVPQRTKSAFDTEWLHRIANLSTAISNEVSNARAKGWKLSLATETGADGKPKSVVTVMATSGVPDNDYTKNVFMDNADTRRVYRFDAQTELLEAVQIYLIRPAGEVQIFDLSQIDYNQPIDPGVWKLDLPADVSWAQLPQDLPKLPDNDKYASMTAEQAARAFFEACASNDWAEAQKFMSPINDNLKQLLGGLQIVNLGQSFTSKMYPGRFVPYEIRLPGQEFNLRVSNDNPAKRFVVVGVYGANLKLQQKIKWTTDPEVLTNNDIYARMSPAEVAKAYFDAQSRFDWTEMRKFTSDADIEETKSQVAMAEKNGMDVHKQMPVITVGDAFWSAEQSAWFVKCRMSSDVPKKWNLAVRKDNPAGRWQVDGGI